MSADIALQQKFGFMEALGGARALAKATPKILRARPRLSSVARDEVLWDLRSNLRGLQKAGEGLVAFYRSFLDIPADQQTVETLQRVVADVSCRIDELRGLLLWRTRLTRDGMNPGFWPMPLHEKLGQVLEDFIEIRETFALGLSDEFHEDLARLRSEAGISERQAHDGAGQTH